MTILPQEIDRSDDYDTAYHGGASQGRRGIHYSNLALMAFIITVRLLKNKSIDVLFSGSPSVITTHGQKLRDAIETTAGFVLDPTTSPYYGFLSTPHVDPLTGNTVSYTTLYGTDDTSYMRLSQKYFTILNTASVLVDPVKGGKQVYERYLFLPVLSKKWLTTTTWKVVPNTH
jgi:hypothetical protein